MAKDKPRKRSKHLVVQTNPFKDTKPPERIAPTQYTQTRDGATNGESYDNTQYKFAPVSDYKTPKYGYTVDFKDARNDNRVSFFAFSDSVNESFQVNYQQIEKLGSPEPIYHYSGTSKQMNINFKAYEDDYAVDVQELLAKGENSAFGPDAGLSLTKRLDMLKTMVYPDVDTQGNPTSPPLVYLTYGQLSEEYSSEMTPDNEGDPLPYKRKKVFGYITSLSVEYSNELGYTEGFKSRQVNISIGFQQINTGVVGRIVAEKS